MSTLSNQFQQIAPSHDPWEAYEDIKDHGNLKLTNIELTTTTICNMRCEHCAVGYTLQPKDPDPLPLSVIMDRLEEVTSLRTLSITGGEPMLSSKSVNNYVLPLLKYAHRRGIRTQINSNLTLPIERYEKIAPFLDVLHISHNWGTIDEFAERGFAFMETKPSYEQRKQYFKRMEQNAKALVNQGVLVSAETMLNKRTLPFLKDIHNHIVEMGCQRHEIHPMYPSDFASNMEVLNLDEIRDAISSLLDFRNKDTWMLFGTIPFYSCNNNEEDLRLLRRLYQEKNVTVRNDPDGRSRLNINIFTGDVIVTDFGDVPPFGNIKFNSLEDAYQTWMETETAQSINCHCPAVKCLGPNLLVKNMYYQDIDFKSRIANELS